MLLKKSILVVLILRTTLYCTLWWLCDGFRVIPAPVCLNMSEAAWISTQTSCSLLECFGISRQARDALQSIALVQHGLRDGSCSVFRFRDVCSELNLKKKGQLEQLAATDLGCEIVIDVEYDVKTANNYFSAVWIGGHGPSLENIVCGSSGPRNPVWATNIVWTSDGAQMNGINSTLLVKDGNGLNFTRGFTLAVELNRNFGPQYVFMELTDCATYSSNHVRLWEYPSGGKFYFLPEPTYYLQSQAVLPNQTDEFFKVAATYNVAQNRSKLYVNNAAISDSSLQAIPEAAQTGQGRSCVKIGYRQSNYNGLKGTVKMAAVANLNLPEDVVLTFFSGN